MQNQKKNNQNLAKELRAIARGGSYLQTGERVADRDSSLEPSLLERFEKVAPAQRIPLAISCAETLVLPTYMGHDPLKENGETLRQSSILACFMARRLAPHGLSEDHAGLMGLCHNLPLVALWDQLKIISTQSSLGQDFQRRAAQVIFESSPLHYKAWVEHHEKDSECAKWTRDCVRLLAPMNTLVSCASNDVQQHAWHMIFQSIANSFESAQGAEVYAQLSFSQDVRHRQGASLGEAYMKFQNSSPPNPSLMDIKRAEINRIGCIVHTFPIVL